MKKNNQPLKDTPGTTDFFLSDPDWKVLCGPLLRGMLRFQATVKPTEQMRSYLLLFTEQMTPDCGVSIVSFFPLTSSIFPFPFLSSVRPASSTGKTLASWGRSREVLRLCGVFGVGPDNDPIIHYPFLLIIISCSLLSTLPS